MEKAKARRHQNTIFIGLDLAWSVRNPSGCAVIRNERLIAYTGTLGDDDEIMRFISEQIPEGHPAIVGIDAPLRVPNASGSRECDRALSAEWRQFEAGALPANRKLLGKPVVEQTSAAKNSPKKNAQDAPPAVTDPKVTVRGEEIVKRLVKQMRFTEAAPIPRKTEDRIVCEIYPHPAQVSLFNLEKTLKYKARGGRSYEIRWAEMERYQHYLRGLRKAKPKLKRTKKLLTQVDVRTLRGKKLKEYEDTLDAIFCAYVANYCWRHGPQRTRVYGTVRKGHIMVPITPQMEERLTDR